MAQQALDAANVAISNLALNDQKAIEDFVSRMHETFPRCTVKSYIKPGVVSFVCPSIFVEYLGTTDNSNRNIYSIHYPRCKNIDSDLQDASFEELMWFCTKKLTDNHADFSVLMRELRTGNFFDWVKEQEDGVMRGTWDDALVEFDKFSTEWRGHRYR